MNRGMGYIHDLPDLRDVTFGRAFGAPPWGPPKAASIRHFENPIRDQLQSEECVGESVAGAIGTLSRRLGFDVPRDPSPTFIWTNARLIDNGGHAHQLQNIGVRPRSAFRGISRYGFCEYTDWPLEMTRIGRQPPPDVYQKASDYHVSLAGYYRVAATGAQLEIEIQKALAMGHPVVFGLEADDGFQQWHGGEPIGNPTGTVMGGHMVMLDEYETLPSGKVVYGIRNSWGDGWGEKGYGALSSERVRHPTSRDFWVLTLVPA